jgi:hypothetical protein
LHKIFYLNWFGQRNPSRPPINHLKYFLAWFQICRDILLFVHSAYSKYTLFRISSVYEQIPSAYPMHKNRFIPFIHRICSEYVPRVISFHIFSVFSVYVQIHSAYSVGLKLARNKQLSCSSLTKKKSLVRILILPSGGPSVLF